METWMVPGLGKDPLYPCHIIVFPNVASYARPKLLNLDLAAGLQGGD
jgi:hypothetical protein